MKRLRQADENAESLVPDWPLSILPPEDYDLPPERAAREAAERFLVP
jgi:hypothetical protein